MRKKIIRREVVYSSSYSMPYKCMGLCATCTYIVQQNGYAMDFYPINTNKAALLALFMIFSLMNYNYAGIIYAFCTESVY